MLQRPERREKSYLAPKREEICVRLVGLYYGEYVNVKWVDIQDEVRRVT